MPTASGGEVSYGRLLRSDNLQDLTAADIEALAAVGLTDVIDLRSSVEVDGTGPGPLRGTEVRHHHHSFFRDDDVRVDQAEGEQDLPDAALPWVGKPLEVELDDFTASTYVAFLVDRPDSVVAALRAIATADGAALVHCAAGKDRTGTTVALALRLVGADRDAVVADYAASDEKMQLIIDRLMTSPVYRPNLEGRPLSSHATRPETMDSFLRHVDSRYGGVESMLTRFGWTSVDTEAMHTKLLG